MCSNVTVQLYDDDNNNTMCQVTYQTPNIPYLINNLKTLGGNYCDHYFTD